MARPFNPSTTPRMRPRIGASSSVNPVVPSIDDPVQPTPPLPTPPAPTPPPVRPPPPEIPEDPDPAETDVDDNVDDPPDGPAPTPKPPAPTPPPPPPNTPHPYCDAARFLLPEHAAACNSLESILESGRSCNVAVDVLRQARDAFLSENTTASVGVWFGTVALAVCEAGTVLSSDMPGAAVAREYAAPVLQTQTLLRFLTETSRREAMITFNALNKDSFGEGLWQLLPSTRRGLREKYAPWLPPWPPPGERGPEFDLTAKMQAEYCGVYVVRVLANLGSNIDFAHGPVRGRGDKASVANSKLKAIGAAGINRGVTITAEMLLVACMNLAWGVGTDMSEWDDAAIKRSAKMMVAIQKNKTWGNSK